MVDLEVGLQLVEADGQQGLVLGPEGDPPAAWNGTVLGGLLVLEHLVTILLF